MDVRLKSPLLGLDPNKETQRVSRHDEVSSPAPGSAALGVVNFDNVPLRRSTASTVVIKATGAEAIGSLIATKKIGGHDSEAAFRSEAQDQLIAAAAGKLGPEAQAKLIEYLDKHANLPEDAGKLTWMASKIFDLSRHQKVDVEPLRQWFYDHGMRLRPWDPLPADHPGYQIDRQAFRAMLREIKAKDGTIDRRDGLALLDQLRNCVDNRDLFWAYGQVMNRIKVGKEDPTRKSALFFADAKTESQFERFFAGRLPGRLAFSEIGLAMRTLRHKGFDDASVAQVRVMLDGCTNDDQAMFYAERAFNRELNKAIKNATPEERERLEAIRSDLGSYFEKRLDGKFDRYTAIKRLERQLRNGEISEDDFMTMHAAALTSVTYEEFAYGTMSATVQMHLAMMQSQILDAWGDIWETISDNISGDERDSNGNIIRTAEQIELEYRRERRLIEQLRFAPEKLAELCSRALLRGTRQHALSQVAGEKDPERRASLESAIANADIQLVDLDPPIRPTA